MIIEKSKINKINWNKNNNVSPINCGYYRVLLYNEDPNIFVMKLCYCDNKRWFHSRNDWVDNCLIHNSIVVYWQSIESECI